MTDGRLITDFTADGADLGWYVLNDNVMGGRSAGDFVVQNGVLDFTGITNTQGGGFSSIRTGELELDLSVYAGLRLYVKGDGRRYTWRLATNAVWNGRPVNYWAEFDTAKDEWIEVDIPFASFVPRFRGHELPGPGLDTGQITGMGLMIYDRQGGPFKLQLGIIRAYTPEAA